MKSVIYNLLKKECVTAVLKEQLVSYMDLSCIEIAYTKGQQIYVARSFFTDSWASMSPNGPMIAHDGNIVMDSIYDIANVEEVASSVQLKQRQAIQEENLRDVYQLFNQLADTFAKKALKEYAHAVGGTRFTFTPVPMVIVSIVQADTFMGSLSIKMNGEVEVLTRTGPMIDIICSDIERKCLGPVSSEFIYVE